MNAGDILSEGIAALMIKGNYWAGIMSRFNIVKIDDIKTIGLQVEPDGNIKLIYNESFIKQIGKNKDLDLLRIVFEHEGMHIVNKHIERTIILSDLKNFDEELCQISCDLAINPLIKNIDYITKKTGLGVCMPINFKLEDGLLFEDYYKLLKQDEEQNDDNTEGGGSGREIREESHDDGIGSSQRNAGKTKTNGSPPSNGNTPQEPECKDNTDEKEIGQPHKEWLDQLDGNESKDVSYQLEMNMRNIVKEVTDSYVKSWGSVPGNIEHLLNDFLSEPRLPYYQIIKRYAIASRPGKQKVAYSKINRKRMYCFTENDEKISSQLIPFPGKEKDKSFNIGVLIDTSMSVPIDNNGIHQALSGIQQILNNDPNSFITLLQVDTEIRDEQIIKKTKDINRFTYRGGGGTNLLIGLFRLRHLKCDTCIVFTDGYFRSIHDEIQHIPRKVIWVLPQGGSIKAIENIGPIVFYPLKEN